mmetsp:Transcript_8512/g.12323  ORF Transcript_8512/g.12323 Transcript_8512/m.12323 type:complete len:438 (-) Transcript_8512:893-2206(-)|eukprot:CAMPEP_0194220406 /NCGR_PEP_ID=MMETSP0156-20130528/28277_1 /TAXON_ID=33649 /ORGANISM="Thalassionema nitzschioides, Strain L26-B" /LENGTH=437 /DNA_ID=CAMNT_0038950425 /DNA_START=53 /DNA_END=1366 /DNA_ORIENTATION=-
MSKHANVLECSPEELAELLLRERFDNNSKETVTFLLQALSCLPDAENLSIELLDEKEDDDEASVDLGEPLAPPVDLSMTIPRAKLTCSLLIEGIYCVNSKKESFSILPQNLPKVIVFTKAEDMRKKEVRQMILLVLKEEVSFKKKPLNQICFQLPQKDPSVFLEKLQKCLRVSKDETCYVGGEGNRWNFKSHDEGNTSTTTAGMPFVTCYKGVQDGHLYPLEEGLLFFKPPHFIPRQSLHSIACGRGASGSSRYVDMNVQLDNDDTIEFTNIHREELNVLNDYIHKVLIPAMKKDADSDAGSDVDVEDEVTESDDAGEDDDETSEPRRPRRKASRDARHTTKKEIEMGEDESNEDDEDDDFFTQGDNEVDSGDSESKQLDEAEDNGGKGEDEFDEDEFFEEIDSDEAGEEEDDDDDEATEEEDSEPKFKRSKTIDGD